MEVLHISKIKQEIQRHSTICILITFAILSFFIVSPLIGTRIPYNSFDLQFHISSVQESYLNLQQNKFSELIPGILTKTFGSFGYPLTSFYPILTFLPEIFIHLFNGNPYISMLIFAGLIFFLIFCSMYVVCKKINIPFFGSFIASLTFGMSNWAYNNVFGSFDLSQGIVQIFLPFVFLGCYEIIFGNTKKWWILAISMFFIVETHILSVFIVSIFVIFMFSGLLFIHNSLKEKLHRAVYMVYAAVVTVLLAAFSLIPLIEQLSATGDTAITTFKYYLPILSVSFQNLIFGMVSGINPTSTNPPGVQDNGIGILGIILIILICLVFKKLSNRFRFFAIGALLFALLASDLFPWQLLNGVCTFLQFPYRFMAIPQLLLSIVGGKSIQYLSFKNIRNKNFFDWFILGLIVLLGLSTALESISVRKHTLPAVTDEQLSNCPPGTDVIGNISEEQFDKYSTNWNTLDYLPAESTPIQDNLYSHSIISMNPTQSKKLKQKHWSTSYDAIHYQLKSKRAFKTIALPNIYYPGFNAYVNGKEVPIAVGHYHEIDIPVKKGTNNIDLKYSNTPLKNTCDWISIISWITLIACLSYGWYRKRFVRSSRGSHYRK